jgi:hypothetical protein
MCQWYPPTSVIGQATPATNFVLRFDTGALKNYKELGKYFSKNCENIKSKDAPHTTKGVQSRFVPPDRVRRPSPHIDRFRKSATADFRHFGRRWIVEGGEPCRNPRSSRRQGPRAGPRAELQFAEAQHLRRLRLHRRLASLARYAATTPPPNVNARVRMRRR